MKIEHLALWVKDLDGMRSFYVQAFGACAGDLYRNEKNRFSSCFLSFADGARLELMQMPGIVANANKGEEQALGYVHMALATGSAAAVDELTQRLRQQGVRIVSEPRLTGDGYYESVVTDPEGNRIEITI